MSRKQWSVASEIVFITDHRPLTTDHFRYMILGMRIRPARRIRGNVRVPGDKSISHRAAILSALARGKARISNFSSAEDCASTLNCLRELGVAVERDGSSVWIEGVGLRGLRPPRGPLDCGNSGTSLRLLAGVLAGQSFGSVLTGDSSLCSRPMRRIMEPLEMMGARILSENNCPPLRLEGMGRLKAISYEMPVESAQVKSCILLAGLNAEGRTEVIEKRSATRDHTERMLRWLNVPVESRTIERRRDIDVALEAVSVEGGAQFDARDGTIPGDISSAAFFIAAAACLPDSNLKINGLGLNPTRTRVLSVLNSLGAEVSILGNTEGLTEDFNEPSGDVMVNGGDEGLAPIEAGQANVLSGTLTAQLIDELPLLAVVGTQVSGGLEIRDAAELRFKESDRISATIENLRALGVQVEEHADGLTVQRQTTLRGAKLDAHGDHRIAMAFAVAALLAEGESEIVGAECARISFPEFFQLLESIVER
jgi:3-phosphoshikimate 1-carboxyvinyltransferase